MIKIKNYKSILCLNGHLPNALFFHCDLPIIAADGAANNLMKIGVSPDLVIGDLDSIKPEYAKKLKTFYHYDQNLCDFQKSLAYLQEQQLLPAIIVGINGGYLDHILNNINYFINTDNVLYAPPLYGYTIRKNETKSFKLPLNTKLSIIGIPRATVSTQGLKWELHQHPLSFPGNNSCFNRTLSEEINVTTYKGNALILIYEEDK